MLTRREFSTSVCASVAAPALLPLSAASVAPVDLRQALPKIWPNFMPLAQAEQLAAYFAESGAA